jgi:hypothetical protein
MVNVAVPFIALLPDMTVMIVQRVFFESPADLYMRRQKLGEANPMYLAELDKMYNEKKGIVVPPTVINKSASS